MSAETSLTELQNDHKHWLREIERWESYLEVWCEQEKRIVEEFTRALQSAETHGRHIRSHEEAVAGLKLAILECERAMIERRNPSTAELIDKHARDLAQHDELRTIHERLKREHHTLMANMAMLKHKPFREE